MRFAIATDAQNSSAGNTLLGCRRFVVGHLAYNERTRMIQNLAKARHNFSSGLIFIGCTFPNG
jgi:hypothetical protein